jgi:N4-gp56 family major capsid protein
MPALFTGYQTVGDIVSIPQEFLTWYSQEIEHNALPIMRFEEFAVKHNDLEKQAGDSIAFTRFGDIERGGALMESQPLIERAMKAAQYSVTVTEYGNAVGVTQKALKLAMHDVLAEGALLLGRDYAMVMDLMLRDTVLATPNTIYCGGRASRAALQGSVDYFDVQCIRTGVEFLQTRNAPKYDLIGDPYGPAYVLFVHPHQAQYLMSDPDWIAAHNYANTRNVFRGELGRWNDVVFIATPQMLNGAAGSGDAYDVALHNTAVGGTDPADVYAATLLADNSYGLATALEVEMRQKVAEDYGRKHGLAWYAIKGAGILNSDYIVRIESV